MKADNISRAVAKQGFIGLLITYFKEDIGKVRYSRLIVYVVTVIYPYNYFKDDLFQRWFKNSSSN